jgi:regulatory protein
VLDAALRPDRLTTRHHRQMARRAKPIAERRAERAAIDDLEVVLAAGLRFLEARSRSVAEVRRRLTDAGYRSELVEEAIGRLIEMGVLDDEQFARLWIESRDRARPRGERALRQELALKGVDRAIVDELLDERRGEGGDEALADSLAAERVLASHEAKLARVPDPRLRRQRAYALLARNGFDPETASQAVRRVIG